MQIGIAYNEILQLVKESGLGREIKLPEDGVKAGEKLELIRKAVGVLVGRVGQGGR